MTPSFQGMRVEPDAKLNRFLGNYLTEAQEARMAETSRQTNAMTARVVNQYGHNAMTATIFKAEQTMLAQTGGNDPDSRNIFAQTQLKLQTPRKGRSTELSRAKWVNLCKTMIIHRDARWKLTQPTCGRTYGKLPNKTVLWKGRSKLRQCTFRVRMA
jgi:hypothetical protein